MTATAARLFEGAEWDFAKLQRIHDACEEIARSELGLDTYPNQIEVITAEQMEWSVAKLQEAITEASAGILH